MGLIFDARGLAVIVMITEWTVSNMAAASIRLFQVEIMVVGHRCGPPLSRERKQGGGMWH